MPKITFIEHSGQQHDVEVEAGQSVMQAAIDNMVPGIIADCGGNCSCATCHVYIDGEWSERVAPPLQSEKEMLECALHTRESSRLSCQIPVTAELDGMIVRLPESQV
jgi:ferredoxin, 2Fe-2S